MAVIVPERRVFDQRERVTDEAGVTDEASHMKGYDVADQPRRCDVPPPENLQTLVYQLQSHSIPLTHRTTRISQAAIAIDRAALQVAVGNLHTAIDTNRDIGAAVGILMAQHNVDHQDAYLLLRSVSQNDNRKLRDYHGRLFVAGRQS
jgi:hypothetical protein